MLGSTGEKMNSEVKKLGIGIAKQYRNTVLQGQSVIERIREIHDSGVSLPSFTEFETIASR
tara:strand:+ start:142 stop:324 length:183 start_codon:yes stop_codon:yes gene_type:complete